MLVYYIYHLSILLIALPFLDIIPIINWAKEILPDDYYIHVFLNRTIPACQASVEGKHIFTIKHMEIPIEDKLCNLNHLYENRRNIVFNKTPLEVRNLYHQYVCTPFVRSIP